MFRPTGSINPRRLMTARRGAGYELRAEIEEFEGVPLVAIGLWTRTPTGAPRKAKGAAVGVRLEEVPALVAALAELVRELGDDGAGAAARRPSPAGPGGPGPVRPAEVAAGDVDPSRAAPWEALNEGSPAVPA